MLNTNSNIVGFLGSSRSDGNTAKLAKLVFDPLKDARLIDLSALSVGPYSYNNAYEGDDFPPLAQAMADANTIIFASPVYWYSMSAQMKTLFDRMTDMTGVYKPLGKSLVNKTMFVISTGADVAAPDSFIRPFADTAGYFKMKWGGVLYAPGGDINSPQAQSAAHIFAMQIAASAQTPLAATPA